MGEVSEKNSSRPVLCWGLEGGGGWEGGRGGSGRRGGGEAGGETSSEFGAVVFGHCVCLGSLPKVAFDDGDGHAFLL